MTKLYKLVEIYPEYAEYISPLYRNGEKLVTLLEADSMLEYDNERKVYLYDEDIPGVIRCEGVEDAIASFGIVSV